MRPGEILAQPVTRNRCPSSVGFMMFHLLSYPSQGVHDLEVMREILEQARIMGGYGRDGGHLENLHGNVPAYRYER